MKAKRTMRDIKSQYPTIIQVGYCDAQNMLCMDTDARTVSRGPDGWVSKDVAVVAKHDMDTLKAHAIADGYAEV